MLPTTSLLEFLKRLHHSIKTINMYNSEYNEYHHPQYDYSTAPYQHSDGYDSYRPYPSHSHVPAAAQEAAKQEQELPVRRLEPFDEELPSTVSYKQNQMYPTYPHVHYNHHSRQYDNRSRHPDRYEHQQMTHSRAASSSIKMQQQQLVIGRGYYDPLSSLRPGPLAPEYTPEKTGKYDNEKSAAHFIRKELDHLKGDVHVIYESTRKFGRFDMRDGRILMDKGESERDYIEGLSRLWQVGDGYIYVRQSGDRREVKVLVFHVDHNAYVKLEPREAIDVVTADPFWASLRSGCDLQFL